MSRSKNLNISKHGQLPAAQRGVVLIVCLVLLAVVTILGLSTMSGVGLELKMSQGARDRAVAFEIAEETLRVAESWLDETLLDDSNYFSTCAGGNCFDANCTNGLCAFYDAGDPYQSGILRVDCGSKLDPPDTPTWEEKDVWDSNSATTEVVDPTFPGFDASRAHLKPRYMIEFLCYVDRVPGNECSAANSANCAPQFRVTALARSVTANSVVMLQSIYKKVN